MSLLTLLVVLLIIAVLFGGYGTRRDWGYYGWSPTGLIVLIRLSSTQVTISQEPHHRDQSKGPHEAHRFQDHCSAPPEEKLRRRAGQREARPRFSP